MSDATPDSAAAPNLMETCVALNLDLGAFRVRRKARAAKVEQGAMLSADMMDGHVLTDADLKWVSATKRILDSDCHRKVAARDRELRAYLKVHALPSPLKSGMFLLPIGLVEDVSVKIEEFEQERAELVEEFADEYDAVIEAARERLGSLFNAEDYPPVNVARASFTCQWQLLAFSVPGKLKEVSHAIWKKEQAKAEAHWREVSVEVQRALRESFRDLIGHMADRLTPDGGGERRVFKTASVTKVVEFLELFNKRNVIGDDELATLVDQARDVLDGVDPNDLRTDDELRDAVQVEFAGMKAKLEDMVGNIPKRRITFDDALTVPAIGSEEGVTHGANE